MSSVVPWKEMLACAATASVITTQGAYKLPQPLQHGLVGTTVMLYFVQFVGWCLYWVFLWPKFLSPLRDLPEPKGNHWLMGQFNRIRKETTGNPHREWAYTLPNEGMYRYLGIFNAERLVVTSPKALSEVLVTNNYQYRKPSQTRSVLEQVIGIGLLLAEGDEHKHQRKGLMPAFSFRHVKELFPVFWRKSCEAVIAMSAELERNKGQGPNEKAVKCQVPADLKVEQDEAIMEIDKWASRATLDIIGLTGMGRDFNAIADPDNELSQIYRTIFAPTPSAQLLQLFTVFLPLFIAKRLPIKRNREIQRALFVVRKLARDLIQAKKAQLKRGEKLEDHDILSTAIESGIFSEENLIDQVMTFLAAGHETTATALTWGIYLMCLHPEVQSRLRHEIREKLPSPETGTEVTAAEIERLPYLNAVCSEILRYYPPIPLAAQREAIHDTTILGHIVPKGTHVYIVPWATNHDQSLWGPDASVFDPERWIKDSSGGAKSNFANLTFIHGPRGCIGERFARGEFASLLGAFVGRFEYKLADETLYDEMKVPIKGGVVNKMANGNWCKVKQVPGW